MDSGLDELVATDDVASWTDAWTAPCPDVFDYAGVRFRVERPAGTPALRFPRALGAPVATSADRAHAAMVDLVLQGDHSLPRAWTASRLSVRPGADVHAVHTGRATARLVRRAERHYQVEAWVACGTRGGAELDLLQAIAAVVLAEQGGAMLHAAAVELDGCACAFIGPSDAGKSTACDHTGERLFAIDRVAVWPEGDAMWAAHVSAGPEDESRLPRTSAAVLPLGCVLRVVQSTGQVSGRRWSRREAALGLRAAMQWPFTDQAGQLLALARAEELARRVCVGEIHTVLGRSNADVVRALRAEGGHGR